MLTSMKKFFKVSRGRSYVAEWAQEIQLPFFTEKAYYINKVGNIYYTRIGVNMSFDQKTQDDRIDNYPYMKECLEKAGYRFSKKDALYVDLKKLLFAQVTSWSLKRFCYIKILKILTMDSKYGLFRSELMLYKRKTFAVLRRLPHSSPVRMTI